MSNYTKTTNFATKDSLPSGNANKIVKGTEIDTEFNNIATAVATKADTAGPTFTGTVTIPTADINGGAVDGTTIGAASASSIVGTTIVANTSINIAGDGATVTGIKDEDDMSSNSATKLATQQSIKAYVDSQLTAQDLDVTDGSSSIDIDLDSESLGILGGTGIDSTASGTGVTLAIDSTVATLTGSQTLTNKTLTAPTLTGTAVVASLDISGDVDVDGTLETDALSINSTTVTSTAAELNILDGVTATASELNILDGVTSTTAELNILDGVTSTAAELNILDGVTSTTAELNILDGVTSTTAELNILDGVTATASELNIMDGVTASTAELNIMDGVTSTTAELNILDGVTSTAAELNILDGKAFLDEDDMSSNSATGIASQQSIKAYVDAQITAEDLDFQADSGGALSIDLDSETLTFTGGTGIDTSGSGNAVTFAIDSTVATLTGSQTLTNKTLTSPDINTPDIDGGTIDNTVIGGTTAAAGSFTTGAFSGNVSLTGSGNTTVSINTGNNSGDNSQIKFGDSADDDVGQINYDHGTNAMQFRTNGASNTLILDNGGNVGISTSDPKSTLEVKGTFGAPATSGFAAGFIQRFSQTSGVGCLDVGFGDPYSWLQSRASNNYATNFALVLNPNGGNVGIGTSSITSGFKLEVTGDARFGDAVGDDAVELGWSSGGSVGFIQAYDRGASAFRDLSINNAVTVSSSGNVGINKSPASTVKLSVSAQTTATNSYGLEITNASQNTRFLVDGVGSSFFYKSDNTQGMKFDASNGIVAMGSSSHADDNLYLVRSDAGKQLRFYRGSTECGSVAALSSAGIVIAAPSNSGAGLAFNDNANIVYPAQTQSGAAAVADNAIDLGTGGVRFQDVFATNGTIQTSDRDEKQDIEALSDAEQRVAVAAKGLLRKFRWKSAVEEKGDDARIHFGIIAQDLQAAFEAEGLDAARYAMFCSDTWTDEETNEERTRLGVRYSELLAFIISAI